MQLKFNSAQNTLIPCGSGTPASYMLDQNGGGFTAGSGAIGNVTQSGVNYAAIILTAGETAFGPGYIYIIVLDAGGVTIGGAYYDVSHDFPGETVQSVVGAVGSVAGNVAGNVAGSVVGAVGSVAGNVVGNVNGNVVGNVNGVLSGTANNAIANALLDLANGVEAGVTPRQAFRLICSVLGGIVQLIVGGANFKAVNNPATQRVAATIPGDGSRPAVTLSL